MLRMKTTIVRIFYEVMVDIYDEVWSGVKIYDRYIDIRHLLCICVYDEGKDRWKGW